jgi:chromosome segregation ATPase
MRIDEQRQRYNRLREREHAGTLTEAEHGELATLTQALCEHEAASLSAANERKAQEIATITAAIDRLEAQNRQLREYLRERQAFLARVRSLVAEIQAEDRRMRERFADVLPLISEPHARKPT